MHSYEDQVADEGEKPGEKEKNRRRAMCGIGWLICVGLGVGILDLKWNYWRKMEGKYWIHEKLDLGGRTVLALRRLRFYRADT